MATRTRTTTEHTERGGSRKLHDQPHRFLGLFLSPFIGLPISWLLYVWTHGVDLHWGPLDWTVSTPDWAPILANTAFVLATGGLTVAAWDFTRHRDRGKQIALTASVAILGVLFTWNVGLGPSWLWSGLFVLAGWMVAILWSLARLDVARNDKRTDDGREADGPEWLKKLKGWKARKVTPIHDDQGERVATEIEFEHADGDTVDTLQDVKPNIESSTGSPGGMSTATSTDSADRSKFLLMHKDPLIQKRMLPPPSSPGGSVADGAVVAISARGASVVVYIGGPGGATTPTDVTAPSNYLFMGMSRAGKTVGENTMITEYATRRDVVFLYLNKSKGMQDLRPVCPAVEVAIIEADADTGGEYRAAFQQLEKIMRYRQQQLGRFGISAYSVKDCFHNPKWRTDPETGKREQMEPMPLLLVHVGEADQILQSDGHRCTTIASKCLSLGIVIGFSMQRADHTQMPTGLRFNLGTAFCFGTSDDVSAGFALSEPTIKAGARPDYWKNRKPGYFYYEGLGRDEELFPVPNRTFGDEDKDVLAEKLLARNLEWAPRMARLDRGSVLATADEDGLIWWERASAETGRIRAILLQQPMPATIPQPATEDDEYAAELRDKVRAARPVADDDLDDDGFDFDDEDPEEVAKDMDDDLRNTTDVDGIELYPRDPETGERGNMSQATEELRTGAEDVQWGDDKPAARDRAAAIAALNTGLDEMLADEALRDPADPTGRTVIITSGMAYDRYPYRERPWFVKSFQEAALGVIELTGGKTLIPAPDLGRTKGKYRLKRDH